MKIFAVLMVLSAAGRGEIIDRVVAIVGREPITWSDLDRESRFEDYFNGKPVGATTPKVEEAGEPAPAYTAVLNRLIEQRLLAHEMEQARFPLPTDAEAKNRLEQLGQVTAKPADYGLRDQDLLEYARRIERTDRFLRIRLQDRDLDTWMKQLRSRMGVKTP